MTGERAWGRRLRARSLRGVGLSLILALGGGAVACGGGEPPFRDGDTPAEAEAVEPAGAESLPPSGGAEGTPPPGTGGPAATGSSGSTSDPPPLLLREIPPPLRSYGLLLVNGGPTAAVVYADAGAGRVLLDTVRRGDSVRVNVQVRATHLRLEATDRWGEPLGVGAVELAADSVARWSVPGRAGAR